MVKVVKTSEIKKGMISAEPITNSFGQVLLPEGIELRENHVKVLVSWNITGVVVKADENEEDNIPEFIMHEAKRDIYARMEWEPSTPSETDMIDAVIRNLANTIYEKRTNG